MARIFQKVKVICLLSPAVSSLILGPAMFASEPPKKSSSKTHTQKKPAPQEELYTINFNNISIIELLKFVGRIADVNFIYEEPLLNFFVTINSKEPASVSDLMAALIQILRVHGFDVMDQGSNLIIHQNPNVTQIATVVSEELPYKGKLPVPMVTRVFRIHNTTPGKLLPLLRPMMSSSALLESFDQTRQLIATDNSANIEKIGQLLESLDAPHLALALDAYVAKENDPQGLITIAQQIMNPLSEGNPVIMVPQPETHSIFIISTPYLIERTISILEDLDSPTLYKELQNENILLYRLKYQAPELIEGALMQIDKSFEDQGYAKIGMIQTIASMRYIKETHALLFTGPKAVLEKLQSLLDAIDTSIKPLPGAINGTFFIYQPKYEPINELAAMLADITANLANAKLADPELLYALSHLRLVPRIEGILFTGDDKTIAQVQEILASIDTPSMEDRLRESVGLSTQFLIYTPKGRPGNQLLKSIEQLAVDLQSSELADPALLKALQSAKLDPETNNLLFTGKKEVLDRISSILETIDTTTAQNELFLYRLQYVNNQTIEEGLKNVAGTLPPNDPIAAAINTMRWLPSTSSFAFRGAPGAIDQIKEILVMLDSTNQALKDTLDHKTYYVYKLQNVNGSLILKDLQSMVKNLKTSGIDDKELIKAINQIEWIQATNSLYISGTAPVIDKIKEMIGQFDIPRGAAQEATKFYIYKPRYRSPKDIKNTLLEIAENLEQANLADPSLLSSISTVRYEKSSNSLIFTGTPDSISKIQELLPEVDLPDSKGIKTLGPSTFLIYQPQTIPADQLMQSLRSVAAQIDASDVPDKQVVETINSMRYVKETNTIIFTGPEDVLERIETIIQKFDTSAFAPIQKVGKTTFFVYQPKYVSAIQLGASLKAVATDLQRGSDPDQQLVATLENMRFSQDSKTIVFTGPTETLEKVQELIEKFDNPSLSDISHRAGPGTYLLYGPKFQHGEDLIETMKDFEKNLITSGIQQSELYDVINNLKWMEKTCNVLISGQADAVQEVEQLLAKFDVPLDDAKPETSIETFDDVSFLIYKLQYHRGDAIEDALKKVAEDLRTNATQKAPTATPNSENADNLVEAINSVQWIEITNSLIGTGKPQTLVKLKELLKSLDIPLRQVFIEVLVLETDISSNLNLGLRWGSQGKYLNKLGWGTGSFPSYGGGTDPAIGFNQSLSNITATNTPTGQNIPFVSGFDLGVIGDLIFHKGKSYASLGAFLNAAKEDGDITIVLDQKLITQDGKNSTLFVGDNIPFIGSTVNNVSQSTIQTSNIEYRDIGVSLSITPTLGDDDVVTLDIDEEITEQLTSPTTSSSNNQTVIATGISTSKTTTTTSVAVPDRHFLVLSGMMRNQTTHDVQSIPCLGGIPILGLAFQNKTTVIEKKNVIIFLKPHIIHSFDEYKKITVHQEDLHRSQASKEEYDAGINLVQTPDDEH